MAEQTRTAVAGALGAVAAGSMVANICSYLIHFTASSWWLSTGEYSELAVGLSATLVLGVAALALQAVIARAVVHHADPSSIRRVTVAAVAVVTALAVAGTPLLAWTASIGVGTAAAALGTAPLLMLVGAGQGVLQGHRRFRLLAWVLAGVGVLRTVPVLLALAAGAGPAGALGMGAVGTAVAAGATAAAVRLSRVPTPMSAATTALRLTDVGHASGVQLVLVLASSIDLLLSRGVLSPGDAGVYALGAIATKVAFWLPQAVGVVFYPRLADPAMSRSSLRNAVGVVAIVGVVLTLAAVAVGPLVPIVVRPAYAPLDGWLWLFAYTGSALAVLQVALLSAIARRATAVSAVTWLAVVVAAVVIRTAVHSFVALAATAAVAATVAAVTTTLVGLRRDRSTGRVRDVAEAAADAMRD